jgi:peptide deformylase
MIQHEIDHLDGVLLLDRVDADVRREALRDMRTRELAADAPIPRTGHDRGL